MFTDAHMVPHFRKLYPEQVFLSGWSTENFLHIQKKKMLRTLTVSTKNVPQREGERTPTFNFREKNAVSLNACFKSGGMIIWLCVYKNLQLPLNIREGDRSKGKGEIGKENNIFWAYFSTSFEKAGVNSIIMDS